MKPPRGLSAEESALWARVTETVTPLKPPLRKEGGQAKRGGEAPASEPGPERTAANRKPPAVPAQQRSTRVSLSPPPQAGAPLRRGDADARLGLDSAWERKLAQASIEPDFTLDLHGHTLDQAHARLDRGLTQAKAMGARLVLLVTGKSRPVDAADRGTRRGAIRAKVLDWLAAGSHAGDIAAIRKAHRRHGGEGALYLVLKRRR